MKKIFDFFIKKKWFLIFFTRYVVLPFFCKHPLYNKLRSVLNSKDKNSINPTHMERDLLIHSLMVLEESLKVDNPSLVNVLASITHDTGKIYSKKYNDISGRVSFKNHESISAYIGGRFLLDFYNKYKWFLRFSYIKDTILIISWHGIYKLELDDLILRYKDYAADLISFHQADIKGRIVRKDLKRNIKEDFCNYYKEYYGKPKLNVKDNCKHKIYFFNSIFTSIDKTKSLNIRMVLKSLIRHKDGKPIPIIAISYKNNINLIANLLQTGTDIVIIDSFNKYKLANQIKELRSFNYETINFETDIKIVSLLHIPSKVEERFYINNVESDFVNNCNYIHKTKTLYIPDFSLVDEHKIIDIKKVR